MGISHRVHTFYNPLKILFSFAPDAFVFNHFHLSKYSPTLAKGTRVIILNLKD